MLAENEATPTSEGPVSGVNKDSEGHPVLAGLAALAGVGLVVGLLVSGGALAATSVLGLGGDDEGGGTSSSSQSMYLPKPSATESATGPAVTLAPGETTAPAAPTTSAVPEFAISLSAQATEVSAMQEIYLTGVYPGGEGKVVQVQRLEDGEWADFATVDAVVSGETFSTYVLTARTGENQFRVRDTDSDAVSNEVKVNVT